MKICRFLPILPFFAIKTPKMRNSSLEYVAKAIAASVNLEKVNETDSNFAMLYQIPPAQLIDAHSHEWPQGIRFQIHSP